MKKMLFLSFILFSVFSNAQVHNRMFKFNVGLSQEQFDFKRSALEFNDTSMINKFDHQFALPVFSITEDFALNQLFSVSGTLGYQMFKTKYNDSNYGTHLLFGSINPQLSFFYRRGFELYIKLKLGMIYRANKQDELADQTQRHFPGSFNIFTGVSGGFNFFFDDNWGLNVELSLWSPEFVNFGLTYRIFKGKLPSADQIDDYYID
jgi:hypothetical protein